MENNRETKKCPYCGEEILAVAKKCKNCGHWLETSELSGSQGLTTIFNKLWASKSLRNSLIILLGAYVLLGLLKFLDIQPLAVIVEIVRAVVGIEIALLIIQRVMQDTGNMFKASWLSIGSVIFWTIGMIVGIDAEFSRQDSFSFSADLYFYGSFGFFIAALLDIASKYYVLKAVKAQFKTYITIGLVSYVVFLVFLIWQLCGIPYSGLPLVLYYICIIAYYVILVIKGNSEKNTKDKVKAKSNHKTWGLLACCSIILGGVVYYVTRERVMILDDDGNLITSLIYDDSGEFHEGLVSVKHNGKWGFIDKEGNEAIPFDYEYAYDFSEGACAVLKGKCGYIDKQGQVIIPFNYSVAFKFHNGIASVYVGNENTYINKEGNTVSPPENKQSEPITKEYTGSLNIPFVQENDYPFNYNEGITCVRGSYLKWLIIRVIN